MNQHKRELEACKIKGRSTKIRGRAARSEKDQASGEAEGLRRDLEHYKQTLSLRDGEIAFLRGHLSQISEKITPALPPSQEEARAKHWLQFWK